MRQNEVRPRKRRRPPTRRKTVRWSSGEVDALLSGVRIHGVGRWATILRHSKVFKGVRTSVDLKDKWRNLTSPVRAAALAARDAAVDDPAQESVCNPMADEGGADMHGKEPPITAADDLDVSTRNLDNLVGSRDSSPVLSLHSGSMPPSPKTHSPARSQSDSHSPSLSAAPAHPVRSPPPLYAQSSPQSPVHSANQSQCLTHTDAHTPSVALPVAKGPNTTAAASTPPTPSESSVSPEVLSTPCPQFPAPSTTATPTIGYPFSYASPYLAGMPQVPFPSPVTPQVAVMQQTVSQGLYQRAAAMTAYYRGMGQEPNPYSIAMALTATTPGPLNPMAMGASSGFPDVQGVDDDDDDDDDDEVDDDGDDLENHGSGPFPFGVNGVYGKNHINIPGVHPAFVQAYSTAVAVSSMIQNCAAQAPVLPSTMAPHTNLQPMMTGVKKEDEHSPPEEGGPGPQISAYVTGEAAGNSVSSPNGAMDGERREEKTPKDGNGEMKMEVDDDGEGNKTRLDAEHVSADRYKETNGDIHEASRVDYSTAGFRVRDEKNNGQEENTDEKKDETVLGAVSTLFDVHNGDHQTFSVTDF